MKKPTGKQLHAAVYSEMNFLSNIIPTNPANMKAILENAHETAKQLPDLARVVLAFIPDPWDGGGVAYAYEEWLWYCKKWPRDYRHLDPDSKQN